MMRRWSWFFCFGVIVFAGVGAWWLVGRWSPKSRVYSVDTLELLWNEVDRLDERSLVVFDIDKVLLTGAGSFHRGTKEQRRELRGNFKLLPKEKRDRVRSKAVLERERMLVDVRTPELIRNLQQRSIKVIALTACLAGRYRLIERLEDIRLQEIKSFGFDFSPAFPMVGCTEFSQLAYKHRHPLFKDGVLFASCCDKGEVLLAFLEQAAWRPSRLVFVDNNKHNVASVERAAHALGVPYLGLHYKAAYKLPGAFDEKLVQFQIDYLIEHETVLTDQEAACLMQNG